MIEFVTGNNGDGFGGDPGEGRYSQRESVCEIENKKIESEITYSETMEISRIVSEKVSKNTGDQEVEEKQIEIDSE